MTSNIFVMRFLHTTLPHLLRQPGRRANPGAAHQLRALESPEDIQPDFADFEADFMDIHKTHKQHERELEKQRDLTRRLLVKQKYFKEKFPNFLTYAEKEQMKLLNNRDPEEWSAEKLAESFPATPDIVAKILRADWKPRTAKRARQHDEAVIKNWELLHSGGFPTLPPELKEHLSKFSDRTRNDLLPTTYTESQLNPELPKPKSQEFSSIITSCKKYKEPKSEKQLPLLNERNTQKAASTKTQSPNDSEDTYLLEKIKDKRQMRLQELKQLKLDTSSSSSTSNPFANASSERRAATQYPDESNTRKTASTKTQSHNDSEDTYLLENIKDKRQMRLQELKQLKLDTSSSSSTSNPFANTSLERRAAIAFTNPSGTGILPKELEQSSADTYMSDSSLIEKFQSSEIVIDQEDRKRFEMTVVKDRIYIPRKLKKKGATYKVEDCYYDDDGEFLYRVPGITK